MSTGEVEPLTFDSSKDDVAEDVDDTSVDGEDLQEIDVPLELPTDSALYKSFPLKTHWRFWFLDACKQMAWLERLHDVCLIDTVENFWALMDCIRPPAVMFHCDYSLFRDGIHPVWEVPENKDGGRLVLQINKKELQEMDQRKAKDGDESAKVAKNEMDVLNDLWEKLLIALIGNRFGEHTASVCGAVCNIRQKGSKITLWTSKATDVETNKAIGGILRRVWEETHLKFMEKRRIKYESHQDAQNKMSSATPHKFEC